MTHSQNKAMTPAQKEAVQRNFLVLRLRGLQENLPAALLTQAEIDTIRAIYDRVLTSLNADTYAQHRRRILDETNL